MCFEEKYPQIKNCVKEDLSILEDDIANLFAEGNSLNTALSNLLTAPAKRLRPLLGFLVMRCLFNEVSQNQHDVLLAVELVHNATLIHDDVIDKAESRRTQETLNAKFDDNLAVVAGDFLLSVSMEKVIGTGSIEVLKNFASAMKEVCLGEISQYFSKFGLTSIEDYVEKSKKKTALLFELAIIGPFLLSQKKEDDKLRQKLTKFAQNFGIAFQIRDDLINVLNADKIPNNDINLGIYTAPVIFAAQDNPNILNEKNILSELIKTKGIAKAKHLMENYFIDSVLFLNELEDNIYKRAILDLVELLRRSL